MKERERLEQALELACNVLAELEKRAAGYTVLTVPSELIVQIEEKRKEIEQLESRISGKSSPTNPNTLPRRDTFFGRTDEISRSIRALSPEDRSWGLIIDGIGGIGKTALAVEVAYVCHEWSLFSTYLFATAKQTRLDVTGEYPLVDNVGTFDAMLGKFARALGDAGVSKLQGDERRRQMLDLLRINSGPSRRLLLILDNLESLSEEEQIAAIDFLRQLPPSCKGIVTSRRRLGDGAVWLRLEKLDWDAARQLIAEDARRAPALHQILSEAGVSRWQELYDATGGSPLALRWTLGLMAARHLSLDRALDLLHGRQADDLLVFIYREARTEMGADDWKVLGALSLFGSPASFEALLATTGLPRLVLDSATERLSAYALVNVLGPDGPYQLHPLTRRMAADELAAHPTLAQSLRSRYVRYWLSYAERYGGSSRNYQTFGRLEDEWANLEIAAAELQALSDLPGEMGDEEAARMLVDLVRALANFLWFRGYWDEQIRLGTWAYTAAVALNSWRHAGWAAHDVAWIHYSRGEDERAARWTGRCSAAWERDNNQRERATAALLRGRGARKRGDLNEAERCYQEVLKTCRELGLEADEAITLNDMGELMWERREYDRAESHYRRALTLAEKIGNKEYQAGLMGNLGRLALERERPDEARAWFERELPLAWEVGRQSLIGQAHWGLARVLEEEGNLDEALPLAEEALQIYRRLRYQDISEVHDLVRRLQLLTPDPSR